MGPWEMYPRKLLKRKKRRRDQGAKESGLPSSTELLDEISSRLKATGIIFVARLINGCK